MGSYRVEFSKSSNQISSKTMPAEQPTVHYGTKRSREKFLGTGLEFSEEGNEQENVVNRTNVLEQHKLLVASSCSIRCTEIQDNNSTSPCQCKKCMITVQRTECPDQTQKSKKNWSCEIDKLRNANFVKQ